jgi:hypothetical protein
LREPGKGAREQRVRIEGLRRGLSLRVSTRLLLSDRGQEAPAVLADFDGSLSQNAVSGPDRMRVMAHRSVRIVGSMVLIGAACFASLAAQTEQRPYARIAIMRAIDGHSVEWEEGYIRHLEWHRRVKDPFKWYSYSVWASSERQR